MAPSEFDLRAALRDGEGDEPNVSHLIMAAEARRAQRRVRVLSTAVVVAAVGGLAAGAVELGSGGGGSGGAASLADRAAAGRSSGYQALHGAAAPMPAQAPQVLARISCPSAAPDYPLGASGGVTNPANNADQLFSSRVASVVVCAYGPTIYAASSPARQPARLELTGRLATRIAKSLERAATTASSAKCSTVATDQFAVIPVDASGNQLTPVTAQLPGSACGAVVTNGSAVRYDWHPPPDVAQKLQEMTPTGSPDSPASATSTH